MYQELGIDKEIEELVDSTETEIKDILEAVDKVCEYNSIKVLKAFHIRLSDAKLEWLTQFVKFGLIGVSNTLISYGIYMLVIRLMEPYSIAFDYIAGSVLGFLLSVLWSFFWNNKFVFNKDAEKRSIWKSLLKTYLSYAVTGIVLSNILLYIFVDRIGISKAIAPFIGLLITVPLNFVQTLPYQKSSTSSYRIRRPKTSAPEQTAQFRRKRHKSHGGAGLIG